MGRSSDEKALSDETLADEASLLGEMLRFCAERWRRRLRSGHLGHHPPAEVKAFVAALDHAKACLVANVTNEAPLPRTEENERFRSLIDSVRDYAIFMLDREGRVASWNAGAERLHGYRAEEILGTSFARFYPPEDVAAGRPDRELRIASDDGRYEEEGWRVRKDGSRFWASVVVAALRDADGRLVGFSKVTRDLTARHEAEEELRRTEERFRLLVDAVQDYAIFMLDPDGLVATWNVGAERIKGYSAEEIVGRHFSAFYTPEDVAAGKPGRALAIAARDGRYAEEGWRVRKDGARFWASVVLTRLVGSTGELIGYAKITRDHSDRKLAEEALRAANAELSARTAELARLNRDLESFSYSLSHDIRSPLRKISASATMLGSTARTPAEQVHLDRLHAGIRTIDATVSGMLALAGVHRTETMRAPIDLAEIATAVIQDLRLGDPQREVETHIPPTLPAFGDAALTRIVLDNLLQNAWKFTARVERPRIEVGVEEKRGKPVWFVRDNGAGFDMARAEKIFEPFERLHRRSEFPGTGIGLATVFAAVQRQGGQIWAEAEPGKGATFWFSLGNQESSPRLPAGDRIPVG